VRALAAFPLAVLCALSLCSCANTLQDKPIPHNLLEYLILAPFPVYWLGGSFHGLAISEVTHDPSDAFTVQYGNCLQGGEGNCVPPLRVITSPDNSFLPGGSSTGSATRIRGVPAELSNAGKTIVLATDGVVVDVYAESALLAAASARTLVPINAAGAPEAPLPAPLADTGFGETPLPGQVPPPLRALP